MTADKPTLHPERVNTPTVPPFTPAGLYELMDDTDLTRAHVAANDAYKAAQDAYKAATDTTCAILTELVTRHTLALHTDAATLHTQPADVTVWLTLTDTTQRRLHTPTHITLTDGTQHPVPVNSPIRWILERLTPHMPDSPHTLNLTDRTWTV